MKFSSNIEVSSRENRLNNKTKWNEVGCLMTMIKNCCVTTCRQTFMFRMDVYWIRKTNELYDITKNAFGKKTAINIAIFHLADNINSYLPLFYKEIKL